MVTININGNNKEECNHCQVATASTTLQKNPIRGRSNYSNHIMQTVSAEYPAVLFTTKVNRVYCVVSEIYKCTICDFGQNKKVDSIFSATVQAEWDSSDNNDEALGFVVVSVSKARKSI